MLVVTKVFGVAAARTCDNCEDWMALTGTCWKLATPFCDKLLSETGTWICCAYCDWPWLIVVCGMLIPASVEITCCCDCCVSCDKTVWGIVEAGACDCETDVCWGTLLLLACWAWAWAWTWAWAWAWAAWTWAATATRLALCNWCWVTVVTSSFWEWWVSVWFRRPCDVL